MDEFDARKAAEVKFKELFVSLAEIAKYKAIESAPLGAEASAALWQHVIAGCASAVTLTGEPLSVKKHMGLSHDGYADNNTCRFIHPVLDQVWRDELASAPIPVGLISYGEAQSFLLGIQFALTRTGTH